MRTKELTLLAVRGFIPPSLTGSKHRMYDTGEATSGGHSGDLPAEALAELFVGLG